MQHDDNAQASRTHGPRAVAHLPSAEKLEGATNEIARALDAVDAIKTVVAPTAKEDAAQVRALLADTPPGERKTLLDLGARELGRLAAGRSIGIDDVGRLYLFASDAVDAAETLRSDAEAILAELPGLWQDRENAKGEWS